MDKIANELYDNLMSENKNDFHESSNSTKSNNTSKYEIEIISAQGLLFDNFINHDVIHLFYIHIFFKGQICHSEGIEVINKDLLLTQQQPIIFQFSSSFDAQYRPHKYNYKNINSIGLTDTLSENKVGIGNAMILISSTPKQEQEQQRHTKISMTDNNDSTAIKKTLIAQSILDERMFDLYSGDYISVELIPCLSDYVYSSSEPPGVIFLRLTSPKSSSPFISGSANAIDENTKENIEQMISKHQQLITRSCRDVFQRLKSWWARLKAEYPHLETRSLKFITEDESGRHRFVGSFVSRIHPGRDLDGPRFAARMVSLIPFQRESSLSGGRVGRWKSTFATVSCLQGDVEDHATLLCSLLLGWGLDAYLALGTIHTSGTATGQDTQHQMHTWVVTFCESGRVVFWESLTGEQITVRNIPHYSTQSEVHADVTPDTDHHFKDIWAVFRHDEYVINIQPNCSVSITSLDLSHWERFAISLDLSAAVAHPGAITSLEHIDCRGTFDITKTSEVPNTYHYSTQFTKTSEERFEGLVMDWLEEVRRGQGLQTHFDETLAVILHPALASYEMDRAVGCTFGNEDFQAGIKACMKRGECFKAFPTCISRLSLEAVKAVMLKSAAAREVVFARSKPTSVSSFPRPARLAVRVRVFPYPRGLLSVWVVVAACFENT